MVMRAIDKIGLTKEAFKAIYKEYGGFNDQFNKNHPEHGKEESFLSFLKDGSESLVKEETDLVVDIINRG